MRKLTITIITMVLLILLQSHIRAVPPVLPDNTANSKIDENTRAQAKNLYSKMPITFFKNQGQIDTTVCYYTKGPGGSIYFTAEGIVSDIIQPQGNQIKHLVLKKRFLNINPGCELSGEKEMTRKINYLLSNKNSSHQTHIKTFQQIRYKNLYPGIDLVYSGSMEKLEYQFEIQPSTSNQKDPVSQIQFTIEGAHKIKLDSKENLLIYTGLDIIREKRPQALQKSQGDLIPVKYQIKKKNILGFKPGPYDHAQPLFIR